jgi:hypothetical protein
MFLVGCLYVASWSPRLPLLCLSCRLPLLSVSSLLCRLFVSPVLRPSAAASRPPTDRLSVASVVPFLLVASKVASRFPLLLFVLVTATSNYWFLTFLMPTSNNQQQQQQHQQHQGAEEGSGGSSPLLYGGACLRILPGYPWRATVRLLRDTGHDSVLSFACPTRWDRHAVILPASRYRTPDSALLTPAWSQDFFQHYRRPSPVPVPSSSADAVPTNRNGGNATVAAAAAAVVPATAFYIVVHIRWGDVEPCNFA